MEAAATEHGGFSYENTTAADLHIAFAAQTGCAGDGQDLLPPRVAQTLGLVASVLAKAKNQGSR